jgi:hypothetical protein
LAPSLRGHFLSRAVFRLCVSKLTDWPAVEGSSSLLTTLPALVFKVHTAYQGYLFAPETVAIGLGIGGVGILLVERFLPRVRNLGSMH